jgi:hypothetical protein
MRYLITKPVPDQRSVVAGVVMPDGFYRIMDMTRENAHVFEWLNNRGWDTEEYEGDLPSGIYLEADDVRYTTESVMGTTDVGSGVSLQKAPVAYVDPTKWIGNKAAAKGKKATAADAAKMKQVEGRLDVNRKPRGAAR